MVQNQATKPRNRGRGHIKAKATADPHFLAQYGIKDGKFSKEKEYQQYKSFSSSQQFTTLPPVVVTSTSRPQVIEFVRTKPKNTVEFDKFNNPLKTGFSANSVAPLGTASPFKSEKIYPSFNIIYNTSLPASSPAPFQKTSELTTTTFKPPTPIQVNNLDRSQAPRFYNTKYETTGTDSYTFAPTTAPTFVKASTYNPRSGARSSEIRRVDATSRPQQYQTIARGQSTSQDNFTPSTAKKFSTLVPKENYNPTTFKPNPYTFKKAEQYRVVVTTTTTTTPVPEGDEDDGQYRPELYEKDLYKNKLKAKLARTKNFKSVTTPRPSNDDDELFNTAQSQNIAASGNELRAERARQAVKEINRILQDASKSPASSTSTPPVKKHHQDKDASYDYAYYDLGEHQNEFDNYGDLIEEFGKTKSSKN